MVETREQTPSKRKLSVGDFSKIALLIGGGASFLTACEQMGVIPVSANEPTGVKPAETAVEPSPIIETTPTAETLPASLENNRAALQQMGYTLRQGERGWELIDPNGVVAFTSADTLTITAFGQNGELIIVPEQAFGITGTAGLGMEQIITLKNEQGVNEYMYLEAGYSVPIQEQYDNFEDLENCPRVDINALWDGTLSRSEAINAKEFPEGTIPPETFVYTLWKGAQTFWVFLSDQVGGFYDSIGATHSDTYHRRFVSCYRSTTPNGTEVIIGTEQILMPDGKTSLFLHYVFGPEWPRTESVKYGSGLYNLTDSVFLSYTKPPEPGYQSVMMRPVVFIDSYDPNTNWNMGGIITGQVAAAEELYQLPQNNPTSMLPGLEELAREREPSINQRDFLDWADMTAIAKIQDLGLYANWPLSDFQARKEEFFAKQN